ncbi:MAG: O-antigen ligase family protein, partial [Candidatus Moraniibacteriota bacterium]
FSVVVAKNTDWSLRKLLFLFSVFPLYFVFSALINEAGKMQKVITPLVFSGFIVSIMAISQFVSQFIFGLNNVYKFWAEYISPLFLGRNVTEAVLKNPSWLVNVSGNTYLRATAMFPDPHMLAFFLGMLIPFSVGLYLKSKKSIYLVVFSTMLLADLLTFSRGGYLGLFFGAIIVFLMFWKKLKKQYRLSVGVVFLLGSLILLIPSPISGRFFSSFDFKEGSNQGRLETWKEAGEIILKNPIIGVGIGNYSLEIKATADYREPIYAHSLYLDIAAETGLIGLFSWLGIILLLLINFIKKAQKEILFFCAIVSVVIFSSHALVETPLYSPIVLPLFLIIIAFNSVNLGDEKNT